VRSEYIEQDSDQLSCDQLLMRTETSNMKPNEPSRTAVIIARQRAAHQVLDHGSILYDPFAMKILREDEKEVLQFANGHPLASIGRLFTDARSRIAEDALSRAVEKGIRQIVILGAGLDTFALRFFTWLGVVSYLTPDAIGRALDYVSSIQRSEVVLDYMEPPEAFSEELRQLETQRTEQLMKLDERSVSRFEPAGIAAILRSHGFGAIEDINFQEIASRFGRAVQGLAPGHAGVHVVHAKH
jgi:O-methyltransferase involved in polyketide biosynthesis